MGRIQIALALLCTLLWGSAYPGVKLGYEYFGIVGGSVGSKLLFAGLRFTAAGMLTILFASIHNKSFAKPKRPEIKGIIILGFVQTFVQYLFYYIGLSNTSGAKGAIIYSSGTFMSVVLAHFLCKDDNMTVPKAFGCLMGLIGIIIINTGNSLGGQMSVRGEGFMLIGALVFAIATILSKFIAAGQDPMTLTGYQMLFGGSSLAFVGVILGGKISTITGKGVILFFYLALLSAVAFSIWTMLLKENDVSKVSIYNSLMPVAGAVLSGVFLGEQIWSLKTVVAIMTVSLGIYIVNRKTVVKKI